MKIYYFNEISILNVAISATQLIIPITFDSCNCSWLKGYKNEFIALLVFKIPEMGPLHKFIIMGKEYYWFAAKLVWKLFEDKLEFLFGQTTSGWIPVPITTLYISKIKEKW